LGIAFRVTESPLSEDFGLGVLLPPSLAKRLDLSGSDRADIVEREVEPSFPLGFEEVRHLARSTDLTEVEDRLSLAFVGVDVAL
jgi:hypothetical protein